MLNPKAVEAFRAIMVTGSATGAAETMRMSQPAVSRLLKALEAALGYALFARVRGRLAPTPEGMVLFEEVERYFGGLDRLEQVAQQIGGKRGRSFRVAAMPAIGAGFLPKVISRLGQATDLPAFAVNVIRSLTVAGMVLSRQCDLGILSGAIDEAGMQLLAEYSLDCLCILPHGHPLAARRVVAWSDFAGYPIAMLNSTTITGVRIATALKAVRLRPLVVIETHHSAVAAAAVLHGSAIAVVDPITAQEHLARGGVVRPLAAPVQFDFKVVKPAGFGNVPTQRALLKVFAAEVTATVAWSSGLAAEADARAV